ncbi:MAG TPA: HD domain-containing phosphohydrolase [Bacillota bacterium]|nr:HD domain-containing phosphohydrolase [Bacillota bacterium]
MGNEDELNARAVETIKQFQNLVSIGIALSAEQDRNRLLEMILTEARRISNADAGTLYMIEGEHLRIKIMHNKTLNTYLGGKGEEIDLPPVPLKPEYVSGYVVINGSSVNIEDINETGTFNFSGPREYDRLTGYKSISMLVIPLKNYFGEVLGVLQLINAMDESGNMICFNPMYQTVIEALSSLAAIAITNAKLLNEIEALFESFVQVMVTAIDSRSPYNATHTERVFKRALLIAREINTSNTGCFAQTYFDPIRLKQLSMAAWLHDIGKIATPLEVMDKTTRLGNRLKLLLERIEIALEQVENESLKRQLELWKVGKPGDALREEQSLQKRRQNLKRTKELINQINNPEMEIDRAIQQELEAAAKTTLKDSTGNVIPLIEPDELACLLIPQGTLTAKERKIMEEHVLITEKMLSKMQFTEKLHSVPKLASMHHEYLDGGGYPYHLKGPQIPLEARILVIADIYEALTASDRPYRKLILPEQALQIMSQMADNGKLDRNVLDIFIDNRIWEKV